MEKKLLFIFKLSLCMLVVMIVFVNFFVDTQTGITSKYLFYQITTGSMSSDETAYEISTINVGDLIIVEKNTSADFYSDLKIGDVITFELSTDVTNQVVTHRIVEIDYVIDKYVIETKGDANSYSETITSSENIIYGKVVTVSSELGKLYNKMKDKYYLLCIICVPAVAIIFYEIGNIFKVVKNNE